MQTSDPLFLSEETYATYPVVKGDNLNLFTDKERDVIVNWVQSKHHQFIDEKGKKWAVLNFIKCPDEVWSIKERVMDAFKLEGYMQEPTFMDFVSYMEDGSQVHMHCDPCDDGTLIHTRINVLLQKASSGGLPILEGSKGGVIMDVPEGSCWVNIAGLQGHGTTKVQGPAPRIALSFGFLIPFEHVIRNLDIV